MGRLGELPRLLEVGCSGAAFNLTRRLHIESPSQKGAPVSRHRRREPGIRACNRRQPPERGTGGHTSGHRKARRRLSGTSGELPGGTSRPRRRSASCWKACAARTANREPASLLIQPLNCPENLTTDTSQLARAPVGPIVAACLIDEGLGRWRQRATGDGDHRHGAHDIGVCHEAMADPRMDR